MLVTMMTVTPSGIGLPQLDQGVRDGTTVFIHHSAAHQDALTNRLAGMLASQIRVCRADPIMPKYRTSDF
jgi:hypothetical protein